MKNLNTELRPLREMIGRLDCLLTFSCKDYHESFLQLVNKINHYNYVTSVLIF
jgi:hypothetical protein